jgi:hypothetical protein
MAQSTNKMHQNGSFHFLVDHSILDFNELSMNAKLLISFELCKRTNEKNDICVSILILCVIDNQGMREKYPSDFRFRTTAYKVKKSQFPK